MKHPTKNKKHAAPQQLVPAARPRSSPMRWVVLGVGLLLAAGATWAIMEFVVWNKLPRELVGTWEVTQGPPEFKEAVFEFQRSGKMIGRLNDNGNLRIMDADVRVEGDKIHFTTRHPQTGEEHVSVQVIRKLGDRELEVDDERGKVIKMTRIP